MPSIHQVAFHSTDTLDCISQRLQHDLVCEIAAHALVHIRQLFALQIQHGEIQLLCIISFAHDFARFKSHLQSLLAIGSSADAFAHDVRLQ